MGQDFFYKHIIRMKRVAIQGVPGAFHEIAARSYFKDEEIEVVACETFKDLFGRLAKDSDMIGIVAIENTIAGSLLQNHHLLNDSGLCVVGEYKLRIVHNLVALKGQRVEDIKEVHSHPIALMQCEDFLDSHKWIKPVESADTALSAKEIAEEGVMGRAAICSSLAAQQYGMEILEESIETNKRNFTRFLIVCDKWHADELLRGKTINKVSFYHLNLTKIQSLPIIGREWEYQFYITVNFDNYTRYRQALDAVAPLLKDFRNLGEYEAFNQ